MEGFAASLRRLFVTALVIAAHRHLQVQTALQRHTDNVVSRMINLPGDAPAPPTS